MSCATLLCVCKHCHVCVCSPYVDYVKCGCWSVTIITVEPPNNGHVGTRHFVLYREVVLSSEVKNVLV